MKKILGIILFSFVFILLIYFGWIFGSIPKIGLYFALPFAMLFVALIIWLALKYRKNKKDMEEYFKNIVPPSVLSTYIEEALTAMDNTFKWYSNEEEANKELVSILKNRGIDIKYQFELDNSRTADAKGDGFIIEGKLEPNTAEVDRLIGQLKVYSGYSNQIYVVIYGRLNEMACVRILDEIEERYNNKVFLIFLQDPKRVRRIT